MKKPVAISSLAVRFYKNQGWDLETLNRFVVRHHPDKDPFIFKNGGPEWDQYYLPEVGTVLDFERLVAEEISEVMGKEHWGETKGLSDLEALMRRQW